DRRSRTVARWCWRSAREIATTQQRERESRGDRPVDGNLVELRLPVVSRWCDALPQRERVRLGGDLYGAPVDGEDFHRRGWIQVRIRLRLEQPCVVHVALRRNRLRPSRLRRR